MKKKKGYYIDKDTYEVAMVEEEVKKIDEIKLNEEETQSLKEILEGKTKIRVVPYEYYLASINTLEDNK